MSKIDLEKVVLEQKRGMRGLFTFSNGRLGDGSAAIMKTKDDVSQFTQQFCGFVEA
jgi:hypothetical protein